MKLFAIGAFALASLAAGSAAAQAQAPGNPGPVIPGVCVFHNDRLLAQSMVGQSVQSGMQRLITEVTGELQPYATTIQTEAQQLQQGGGGFCAGCGAQRQQGAKFCQGCGTQG
jgi:outer membrane protein